MTDIDATEILPLEPLCAFGAAVYEACGVPPADAALTVEIQLTADLRGVDTHGFQRLPWYAGHLREGRYNPTPSLATIRETPVSLLVDGDGGIGQLVVARAMQRTIAKAHETGLALGALRNSNDWGMGAYYPMMAAAEGFVSFCTTTSVPTLAPFGARTRMTGNNPMAFAAPRAAGPPMVLDMALTPVALGKVMRARAEGREIPEEWGFLDLEGQPTTDPQTALGGIIPALGAVSAYKGTGLSLFMNTLAGALPGSAHSAAVEIGRRGQFPAGRLTRSVRRGGRLRGGGGRHLAAGQGGRPAPRRRRGARPRRAGAAHLRAAQRQRPNRLPRLHRARTAPTLRRTGHRARCLTACAALFASLPR